MRCLIPLAILLCPLPAASAGELTVAVASNFRAPAEELAELFTQATDHRVRLSVASTGKLYAQIVNGAPFDVFLAADTQRPRLLEQAGLGVAGTRFTYALGSLVLWSRDPGLRGADCREALADSGGGPVAIANPAIAPYGAAAREFLTASGLWPAVEPRLVYGENIAQALHFVVSANATLGFIARSQAIDPRLPPASCSWAVPDNLHAPVAQQALVLTRAQDSAAAGVFIAFLKSAAATDVIRRFGYKTAT
jgi:molybdate transport system substrate-binding protein